MTICYSRAERYDPHTVRCAICKLSWDIDDPQIPVCPRQVPLAPLEFASSLPFVDSQHRK